MRVKAGIGARGTNYTQTPPPTGPPIVIPAKAGIQRGGVGAGKTAASLTLVNSDYPLRHPGESPGQNLSK